MVEAVGRVPVEQRPVVAADVDDEVAGLELHDALDALGDAVEVVGHRAIDAAAVPIRAVEDRPGDGVLGLDQATRGLVH